MTGIFHHSSQHLAKVMDKVVAGSVKVLVFVALSLVEASRHKIASSDNAYDAVTKMRPETEDAEARIITVALERWAKDQQRASSTHHHPAVGGATSDARSHSIRSFGGHDNGAALQFRDNYAQPNFSLSHKIVVADDEEDEQ